MSWAEKRCYVTSHVDRVEVKQRTKGPGIESRRTYSCKYFLRRGSERVEVCQNMFSATLGMNNRTIYNCLNNENSESNNASMEKVPNKKTTVNISTPNESENRQQEQIEDESTIVMEEHRLSYSERIRLNKERENAAREYLTKIAQGRVSLL